MNNKKLLHHNLYIDSDKPKIFGAVDLGTNNCRLLVARAHKQDVRIIDSYSKIVRLGQQLGETGSLQEEAIDRTIQSLKVCVQKLAKNDIDEYRAVTTAACRLADNSEQFIKKVQAETGLILNIISPQEEARLSACACANLMDLDKKYSLVFDIGGGSTEFCWVKHINDHTSELVDYVSIPYGVSNLTEKYNGEILPLEVDQMIKENVSDLISKHQIDKHVQENNVQLIGNSGTVTALAAVNLELLQYDRGKVDGYDFTFDEIRKTSDYVCNMSVAERIEKTCISEDRADFMASGCGILRGICSLWPTEVVRVADRGLREGILYDFFSVEEDV